MGAFAFYLVGFVISVEGDSVYSALRWFFMSEGKRYMEQ